MKNKSKLAKIKKNKAPQYPKDWLYMCKTEQEFARIKEILEKEYSVEYWEEAGVIEVEMEAEESSYVTFETVDIRRADEETQTYMEQNNIKTVFLVSVTPETFESAKNVMEKVISKAGGFFCGDTEDFTPVVQ